MNKGELKAIAEDFEQIRAAIILILRPGQTLKNDKAEAIASRIIAAKIIHGDYKGKDFYNEE